MKREINVIGWSLLISGLLFIINSVLVGKESNLYFLLPLGMTLLVMNLIIPEKEK